MITGVHALIYSREAEAVRALLGELLDGRSVDDGQGWRIFALPPAEVAVHPTDGEGHHELYLMCDDVEATIAELAAKGDHVRAGGRPGMGPADLDHAARRQRARALPTAPRDGDRVDRRHVTDRPPAISSQ